MGWELQQKGMGDFFGAMELFCSKYGSAFKIMFVKLSELYSKRDKFYCIHNLGSNKNREEEKKRSILFCFVFLGIYGNSVKMMVAW